MDYLFESEPVNPVNLEKELGLSRGDIESVTIYSEGSVEIKTSRVLSSSEEAKIKDALTKRGLPRGKKPSKD